MEICITCVLIKYSHGLSFSTFSSRLFKFEKRQNLIQSISLDKCLEFLLPCLYTCMITTNLNSELYAAFVSFESLGLSLESPSSFEASLSELFAPLTVKSSSLSVRVLVSLSSSVLFVSPAS